MPAKRLSMRKIKEVLRLKWGQGLSNRKIAAACGIARPTVSEYLRRAGGADLSGPLPGELTDTHLEQLLFPPPPIFARSRPRHPQLVTYPPGAETQRRHSVPALAGIPGNPPSCLSVQLVLWTLSGMARQT